MQPYNPPPPNYHTPYGAPPHRWNILPWIVLAVLATVGFVVMGVFVGISLLGAFEDFPPFPDSPPEVALTFTEQAAIEQQFAAPGVYRVTNISLYRSSAAQINSMTRNIDRNLTGKKWSKTENAKQIRYVKSDMEYAVVSAKGADARKITYLPSYLTSNLTVNDAILLIVTIQNVD